MRIVGNSHITIAKLPLNGITRYVTLASFKHPKKINDDPRLYKTVPLPAEDNAAISCIARSVVNPQWEPTRLTSRHRDEFRYLFPSPKDLDEREDWEKYYVTWAKETKERYRERMAEIYEQRYSSVAVEL